MGPAIHINDPVRMRSADIHDEDALQFRQVHKLDSVGGQKLSRSTRWLAPRMRFELVGAAIRIQLSRPWLKRKLHSPWRPRFARYPTLAGQPDTRLSGKRPQVHSSIRPTRRRTGWPSWSTWPPLSRRARKLSSQVRIRGLAKGKRGVGQYQSGRKSKYPVSHRHPPQ